MSAGDFLEYLVHQRGIEFDNNKAKAIIEAKPPNKKKNYKDC